MKKRWFKIFLVFLLAGLLITVLAGCSFYKKLAGSSTDNSMSSQRGGVKPEAVKKFFSSIRPYQESTESVFRRARYFQENKKYRLAIQEFDTVVRMDPKHTQAYNNMGICYDHLGEYEQAVSCYQKALAVNPELAHIQNNLGYAYFLKGDLDLAITAFKKAIALDPQRAIYHNNLGLAYAEKGNFLTAFNEFSLSGGENKAHYNLAKIYLKKGLNEKAQYHLALSQGVDKAPEAKYSLNPHYSITTQVPHPRESGKSFLDLSFNSKMETKINEPIIEVSNGNGIRFMARDVSKYLSQKGYKVQTPTNAETFNYKKTIIYYREGYLRQAYSVAKELPGWSEMIKEKGIKSSDTKIRVVIGKDLISYRKKLFKT